MKRVSETTALTKLRRIKDGLRSTAAVYELRAKSCSSCETPGACCLDEHFVNVRVSRLEAVAIADVIERIAPVQRAAIEERIRNVADDLTRPDDTFACPLYERGNGCIVHNEAKPVPCIVHACYERREELPPDVLQDGAEAAIYRLNERVYGCSTLEPLPTAVQAILRTRRKNDITSPATSQPAT